MRRYVLVAVPDVRSSGIFAFQLTVNADKSVLSAEVKGPVSRERSQEPGAIDPVTQTEMPFAEDVRGRKQPHMRLHAFRDLAHIGYVKVDEAAKGFEAEDLFGANP